jgi:hypothetical protein
MNLKSRVTRLEAARESSPDGGAVSLWDVLANAAPMPAGIDAIDPRDREMLDEALRVAAEPAVDRVEERLQEALAHAEADDRPAGPRVAPPGGGAEPPQ